MFGQNVNTPKFNASGMAEKQTDLLPISKHYATQLTCDYNKKLTKSPPVHELVADVFMSNLRYVMVDGEKVLCEIVHHMDGDGFNNYFRNLRFCTSSQNSNW